MRSATAISPVFDGGRVSDLHTLGHHLAIEGHSLDEVLEWFHQLASRSRAFRQVLEGGGIIQVASGWAEGQLQHDTAQTATAFEVLRLRLRQQVQGEGWLGQHPGANLALVVIETDGSSTSVERVAHHARAAFDTGETIAATPSGKLIILVRRDDQIHERTMQLSDVIRADIDLVGTLIRVWIEPLAMSADHLDSHLLGLAG